jgi:hypothetical protein
MRMFCQQNIPRAAITLPMVRAWSSARKKLQGVSESLNAVFVQSLQAGSCALRRLAEIG